MIDATKLVRRAPSRPIVWLGDPRERVVEPFLGERFGAYRIKERDLVLDLDAVRERTRNG